MQRFIHNTGTAQPRQAHLHFTLIPSSQLAPLPHTPITEPHNTPVTMAQSPKKESQDPLIGQSGVGQDPVGQKTDKEQRDGECEWCGSGAAMRGGPRRDEAWRIMAGGWASNPSHHVVVVSMRSTFSRSIEQTSPLFLHLATRSHSTSTPSPHGESSLIEIGHTGHNLRSKPH